MTTNKTIDGVPRNDLELVLIHGHSTTESNAAWDRLRALLESSSSCKTIGSDFLHWSNDHAEVEGASLRVGAGVTIENVGCASEEGRKPILVFDAAKGHLTEVNLIDVSIVSKRRAHTLAELKDIGVRVDQPAPVAVVLPERQEVDKYGEFYDSGWNDCLDELKRLNPSL